MSKFVKRNTVVTLEIDGTEYRVDIARDEVGLAMTEFIVEFKGASELLTDSYDPLKEVYKKYINTILGEGASDDIFKADNTLAYHDDIFLYLKSETEKLSDMKLAPYIADRATRRTK